MIITIICDVYEDKNNGTVITCDRLIAGLKKRGHQMRLVCISDGREPEIFTVPRRSFWIFNSYVKSNGVALAKKDYATISRAVKGSDVVHIMLPFVCGKLAIKAAKEFKVPVTAAFHAQPENVTTHFFMRNFPPANSFLYWYFKHKIFKHTNYIHCPTRFVADLLDKHGYKAKKYVISNGLPEEVRRKPEPKPPELKDKFCIVSSGRFSSEKRQEVLIRAAASSRYKDKIYLIFTGKGPKEKKLKKLALKKGVQAVFGFFSAEELHRILNYSDLYVHPSDVELESIACLEAIASGLVPIISDSKKSATRYFALHPENKFSSGSYKDLAAKIDYFIEHPEVRETMAAEYEEYAGRFRIEECMDAMVGMFNDAIRTNSLPV